MDKEEYQKDCVRCGESDSCDDIDGFCNPYRMRRLLLSHLNETRLSETMPIRRNNDKREKKIGISRQAQEVRNVSFFIHVCFHSTFNETDNQN